MNGDAVSRTGTTGTVHSVRRIFGLLVLLTPLVAGWSLGSFLREVQATVVPYQIFLILGALAGQLQFTPPHTILLGSQIGVVVSWLMWSWLLHRRTGQSFAQSLRQDASTYAPMLALLAIIPIVDQPSLTSLKYLLEPLVLCMVGSVCMLKAWQWSRGSLPPSSDAEPSSSRWVWVLFAVASIVFSILGILQFRSWSVPYSDTGYFEEMLWNTLHGRFLFTNNFPHMFLGEHVQVVQLIWLPFYAVWPSMECLTILQSVAIAAGVFPVWWFARRKWDDRRALWFPILYLLQPALHFAAAEVNYNTVRPEAFLIPTVLFGLYFLEKERWTLAALFGVLVLLNREDMAIVCATSGIYLALVKKRWKAGLIVVLVCIAYFFACMEVIIPHFNATGTYARKGAFEGMGSSSTQVLVTLLTHPGVWLERLFRSNNLLLLVYLLFPLGLLCLGRAWLSLVALPYLLAGMITTGDVLNTIYFHYHNPAFAILMAATPGGAAAVAAFLANRCRWSMPGAEAIIITCAVSIAVGATVIGSKPPLSLNFYYPSVSPFHYSALYERSQHARFLEHAKGLVPADARVCATIFAATHFVKQRDVFLFPQRLDESDYAVVDVKGRWSRSAKEYMQKLGEQGIPGFDPIWIEDGVFVFKRRTTGTP